MTSLLSRRTFAWWMGEVGRRGVVTTVLKMATQNGIGDENHAVSQLRPSYREPTDAFTKKHLSKEPIKQFEEWFNFALNHEKVVEPNCMTLSTVSEDGKPSARIVLLKSYGKDGFKFFTNYESRKAREISLNPNVALVFYWGPIHRSVRVEGVAEKLPEAECDKYFATRPRPSQIAAHVSAKQSAPIESREKLWEVEKSLTKRFDGCEVPRPNFWGGYLVRPHVIEFWQGQSNRMHDRLVFQKSKSGEELTGDLCLQVGENGWVYQRLMP